MTTRASLAGALAGVAVLVAVAACAEPAVRSPSPSASASAAAEASGRPSDRPSTTRWPTPVLSGVKALGLGDREIQEALTDLERAAATEDVALMQSAANGLVAIIEHLEPSVDAIEDYPRTQQVAGQYRAAFPSLLEGARQVRDSLVAGDPSGVAAGSRVVSEGVAAYGLLREELAELVNEAIFQERVLLR
jgi:hypothetical protein